MLAWLLVVRRHSRRSVPSPTTSSLPHSPPPPLSSNSFPHNPFSHHHPLNPPHTIFYKNCGGRGPVRCFERSDVQTLRRSDAQTCRRCNALFDPSPVFSSFY